MNPINLKSVIFDLDGTLLDTADEIHYIFNKVLEEDGLNGAIFTEDVDPGPKRNFKPYGVDVNSNRSDE